MPDLGVCVVAGVGPGVGAAVARRFAAEGFTVALLARSSAALAAVAAEIGAAGGTARSFPVDMTDLDALAAVLDRVSDEIGPPGVLVYTQAVWPAMRAAGRGTVIWTGGGLALAPQDGTAVPALTAGKSALRGLALAAAPELPAGGVRLATVTIAGMVAPGGPFDPDRIAGAFWAAHAAADGAPVETVFSGA